MGEGPNPSEKDQGIKSDPNVTPGEYKYVTTSRSRKEEIDLVKKLEKVAPKSRSLELIREETQKLKDLHGEMSAATGTSESAAGGGESSGGAAAPSGQ